VSTRALQQIQACADAVGAIDWLVQLDSTTVRAHQHAAATARKRGTNRPDEPDDHALGRSRGGLTTKIHLACDGKGRPLAVLVTRGQRHDSICARPLPERIRVPRTGRGRPRCKPDQVIADKAYSSRGFRAYLRYRQRNIVERCFNRLKGFRGIATRCEKTATSYEAAVTLASFLIWARSV
jgi:transposase